VHDPREAGKVKHDLLTPVRQRLFAIALGYGDNTAATRLAKDPALKIMTGKAPENAGDLASQPPLSRFEHRATAKDLRRLSNWLLDLYFKTHSGPRSVIVLDMDATDDPTHGQQQLSFFHKCYKSTCITCSWSSTGAPAFLWRRCCIPATPTPPTGPWRYSSVCSRSAKAQYTHLGSNQRFVVTNLSRNPHFAYDYIHVLRGDAENRIKELNWNSRATV
jgi:hypothetical protein